MRNFLKQIIIKISSSSVRQIDNDQSCLFVRYLDGPPREKLSEVGPRSGPPPRKDLGEVGKRKFKEIKKVRLEKIKIKKLESIANKNIIKLKNKLLTKNYKKMKHIIEKINIAKKSVKHFSKQLKKINFAQIVGAVLIFSMVSFLYNPGVARADWAQPAASSTGTSIPLRSGATSDGSHTVQMTKAGTIYLEKSGAAKLVAQSVANNLTVLAMSGSPTNYTFANGTYTYYNVSTASSSVTLTPTFSTGSVTINGSAATTNVASGSITLSGTTTITVVASQSGYLDAVYTIKVLQSVSVTGTTGSPTYTGNSGTSNIYKFTGSGSITTTGAITGANVLVVAGGGGGGGWDGGGGGGGGYISNTNFTIPSGTTSVTVGVAGAAGGYGLGGNGYDSVFSSITATGGGGGAASNGAAGSAGGSGGGGQPYGAGTAGQGYNGGSGSRAGGGGAGGAGTSGSYGQNAGGPGISNSITGSSVTYAAGGTGGDGSQPSANTGNGGAAYNGGSSYGGGSGIVVLSFSLPSQTPTLATPTFSPSGTGTATVTTTIAAAGSPDHIYYTTDGTDPTTSSTLYSGAITTTATTSSIIKAISTKSGYSNSAVGVISYTHDWNTEINTDHTAFIGKSSAAATTPYSVTLTAGLSDGAYNVVGVDNFGNTSPTVSSWLTVDNTAPTGTVVNASFTTNSIAKGGNPVALVASGETGGAFWFAPTGMTQGSTFTPGNTMTTASATGSTINAPANAGTYYLYILDAAGNVSVASTATLTVDNTGPTMTGFTLPTYSTATVSGTLSATDASGVASYLITQANSQPSATASGWSTSPVSFTPAAGGGSWTTKNTGGTWFYRIAASANGMKLVTGSGGGQNGYIYTSIDGGANWTKQTNSGQHNWSSFASSSDGTKLIATDRGDSNNGYVYMSVDSGVNWTQKTDLGTAGWIGSASSLDGTKLVVASLYSLSTSTNSGSSWTSRTTGASVNWNVASSSDGSVIAVVDGSTHVYISTNGGAGWTQKTMTGASGLYNINLSSDGTVIAAVDGNGYKVYVSTDSGANWASSTLGSAQLNGLAMSSNGTKMATGAWNGYVYTSADAGATWTQQTGSPSSQWAGLVYSSDGSKLAGVANSFYVYTSSTEGLNTLYGWAKDTVGNVSASSNSASTTIDSIPPVVSAVAPATNAFVKDAKVSYTLTEATSGIASGSITWTRVSGTVDAGSPHVQALTGTELNTGAHSNITLTNNPTLVDGTVYKVEFNATDGAGNAAATVTSNPVTYDTTAPAFSSTAPVTSAYVKDTKVSYTLTEANTVASGSITWTRTSGTADAGSPHVQALTGTELNTGAHSNITLTNNPTLVDGTVYSVAFSATDNAGNTGTATNTGVTYDTTAPTVAMTYSPATAIVGIENITATYSEAVSGTPTITINRPPGTGAAVTGPTAMIRGAWVSQASGKAYNVAYGNNVFVSVATDSIKYSSDGITWTPSATLPLSGKNWWGLAFGGGMFVTGSSNGASGAYIMSSTDGINWTQRKVTSDGIRSIAYGNGYFVAVGMNGYGYYSSDGTNWTTVSGACTYYCNGVAYGNGKFIGVSNFSNNYPARISSDNGVSWTNGGNLVSSYYSIAYGNNMFIAAGLNGSIYTSTNNGTSWTAQSISTSALISINYVSGLFIIGSADGYIYTSADGTNWVNQYTGKTRWDTGVAYGNNNFVMTDYYDDKLISSANAYTYAYNVLKSNGTTLQDGTTTIGLSTVTDTAGNNAVAPTNASFTVDTLPPAITTPINTAQRLKSGTAGSPVTTTSNVQIDKAGDIYIVKNGNTPTTQSAIDALVTAKNAAKVVTGATAATPYTFDIPLAANINDGAYNFVAVSTVGNISDPFTGWLTIDNTAPVITVTSAANASAGTTAGWLKIGDTITFTITPTTTEANATVGAVSYNGQALTWTTANSGVTYTSTYTVNSGQSNQASPLQLTGVTLTDTPGNTSTSASTSDVTRKIDANAPTNQNSVFAANFTTKGTASVGVSSSGDATNNIWFAPTGTTTFTAGPTMTTAGGTATSILSPSADGTYYLYVVDAAGNISPASTHTLIVDAIPPTPSAPPPYNVAQVLKTGAVSTSKVQIDEQGKIYLIKHAVAAATQADLDAAVNTNHNGFIAQASASGAIPYTVTIPAGLVDGVYDIVGVDLVGNISSPLSGWLTVDNTVPTSTISNPGDGTITPTQTTIVGTASDANGINKVQISIKRVSTGKYYNGSGFTSDTEYMLDATGGASWSYAIANSKWISIDDYTIKSYATDTALNLQTATTTATFTFDNTPPEVDITYAPVSPEKVGDVVITATYTKSIVGTPLITIDQPGSSDKTNQTMVNASGDKKTWTYSYHVNSHGGAYADGTANVSLSSVNDSAGNQANLPRSGNTFVIDTTAPTSTITPICSVAGNGCTTEGQAATPQGTFGVNSIAGTAADTSGSGVILVEISLQDTTTGQWYSSGTFNSPSEVYMPVTGTDTWTYNSSAAQLEINHIYQINERATDTAGNISAVQPLLFQFTNSPPTVSNVTASENAAGLVTVGYDITDHESTSTSQSLFYGIGATLSGDISSGTTSITLSDTTYLPTTGKIIIDNEIISYTGKSGNTLSGVVRGAAINYTGTTNTTTPYIHSSGTPIYVYAPSATGAGVGFVNIGTGKTITWQANTDANGYQNSGEIIKVVANDGATGSMIGQNSATPFNLDAASPTVADTSLLINDSSSTASGTSPNITLKLQNVVGKPANENIFVQFSRDGGTTWYGANANGTLSGVGTLGTGFSSNPTVVSAISWPWVMQSRAETITVKVSDNYSNFATDTNTVGYNAPPAFDSSFGTDGISVSQISDSADANFGKVKIQYSIKDTDTDGDAVPNFVTPTFAYDSGSGFTNIADSNINYTDAPAGGQIVDQNSDGVRDNKVLAGSFLTYTAYWTPPADISTATASFKITVDDHEALSNTTSKTISSMTIDSKKPTVSTPVTFDAGIAGVTDSATITIPKPSDLSAVQYRIADDSSNSSPQDTGWVNMTADTTIPWTFDSVVGIKTIKYQFRDAYANTTSEVSTSTLTPVDANSFVVQDASNPKIPSYDMYISWKAITDTTGFASYRLEYATSSNNVNFSPYQSIGTGMSDSTTNYYVHQNLDPTKYYRYILGVVGTNGNISVRSGGYVTAKPDGTQNYGEGSGGGSVAAASQVVNVVPIQGTDKNVTITYKLTDPSIAQKHSPSYEARVFYNIGITLPSNADAGGNITVSDASKLKSSGYIQINNEVLNYTGKSGNTLTGITHGTWPTDISQGRATRPNLLYFAGTPVWVMATTSAPDTIVDTHIANGQNGTITWTTYDESALAGGIYNNVGIRVLVHDNQDAGSGPLSTQSDYSENGILNVLDLNTPTVAFSTTHASGLQSVTPAVFTINLSRVYPINVTVNYAVTGTAVGGGVDYTLPNGTATITAGLTTATLSSVIVDHSPQVRPNKTIIVTLSNPTNATLGTNTSETYTIINHGADTTPPVVTLVGNASMHVVSGTVWATQDPGATAIDDVDGNITSSIVETGTVDMNTPSTTAYTVTYTATDSSNNVGTATRDVYVDDANAATFDITVTQKTHGFITPDGTTSVHIHSDQAYTITPDDGYKVDGITIDTDSPLTPTVGVNHYTFHSVTAPHTITASYSALPDTTKPTITILGTNPAVLTVGDTYVDAGATAEDTYLGVTTPLTSQIEVVSNVDTTKAGSYKVIYTVADAAGNIAKATRTVNVTYSLTYTITATSGPYGSISPPGATQFGTGTDTTYTITPNDGYEVETLIVDGVSLAPATSHIFTNIIADHTIAATFKALPDTTKPTITIIGPNPVNLTVGDTYTDQGATAEDTYLGVTTPLTSQIQTLSNVDTTKAGTYTVQYSVADAAGNVATATRTVTVAYSTTYTITASVTGGHGTIDPSGVSSISTGHDIVITMTPDDGYTVATLTVDGTARAAVSTYTFTNVVTDHTINVTFSALPDTTPPTVTLNGASSIQLTVGDTYSELGATATDVYLGVTTHPTVTISGAPNSPVTAGTYHVLYMATDIAGNVGTVTRTVTVTYNQTYTITASTGDSNGTISPSGAVSVLTGANKMFTITPNSGYVVATLVIDGVSVATAQSYTFLNVTNDHTISATFSQTIDITPPVIHLNGDATVSVVKDSTSTYNDPGATATDNVDTSVQVSVSGTVNMSVVGTYTLTYTAHDTAGNQATPLTRTVNVTLADSYNITATAGQNGTISPLGATSVATHGNQTYTITPSSGYGIDTFTVDGVKLAAPANNSYTFSDVTKNHTIDVTFTNTPDTTPPTITVTGNTPDTVIVNSVQTYTDPGVTVTDDRDGTCTSGSTSATPAKGTCVYSASGTVNTTAAGSYTLTYTAKDSSGNTATATRSVTVKYADTYNITVNVGNHGSISPTTGAVTSLQDHTYTITPDTNYKTSSLLVDGKAELPDTTYTFTNVIADHTIAATFSLLTAIPPTITVAGANPMSINSGTPFVDPGATAVDSSGTTVTVVTTGTVNVNTAGAYTITYTATDTDGNTATATRTVNVVDITPPTITDIATPVITTTAVAITWTTNEKATSQVEWGTVTGALTNTTTLDSNLNIYHVATLTGLTENTPYFFRVISVDASHNSATSDPESTFTTVPSVTTVINPGGTGTTNNAANDNTSKYIPDLVPPKITAINIHDITAFDAKVSFTTDEDVLSFVEYGLTAKYGNNSADGQWGKTHDITLGGLKFGTLYHMRVTAIDKSGNAASTEDQTFTTKYFSENPSDLTKIENVQQYQSEIEATIESILPALIPPFVEEPKIIDLTQNSATVTYRTNIKTFPVVAYVEDSSFDATKANPYTIETSDTTEKALTHTLNLLNLKPNTKYHLQARAFSLPQVVGKSQEITFTTKPSKIHGTILQKKYDSFVVVWTTDTPTTSIVEYKNLKSGETSRVIDNSVMSTSHSVPVENLTQGTSFSVKISGVDKNGNVFEGDAPISVTTPVDVTPPVISSFKVESSLVTGRTDRAQSIVSWSTDKPSTSTVYYEEGSGSPDKPLANKQEDIKTFTTNHVVILSVLKPGTIYRFQISSTDGAGNVTKLPIRTIITPTQSQSIVDIIFKNFDQTFGFLQNIK